VHHVEWRKSDALSDRPTADEPPFGFRLGCALIPSVLAIGLLLYAWYGNESWRGWGDRLTGHWERTRGLVLRVEHQRSVSHSGQGAAYPVVQYQVAHRTFEVTGNSIKLTGWPERPGDTVDVLYKRENPAIARMDNAGDNIPIYVLTLLAMFLLYLGLVPVLKGSLRRPAVN
jgi:hypothetical protein